jgi:hypothetical protein
MTSCRAAEKKVNNKAGAWLHIALSIFLQYCVIGSKEDVRLNSAVSSDYWISVVCENNVEYPHWFIVWFPRLQILHWDCCSSEPLLTERFDFWSGQEWLLVDAHIILCRSQILADHHPVNKLACSAWINDPKYFKFALYTWIWIQYWKQTNMSIYCNV